MKVIDVACPKCHRAFKAEIEDNLEPDKGLYVACDHCGVTKRLSVFQKERVRIEQAPTIAARRRRREADKRKRHHEKVAERESRRQEAEESRGKAAEWRANELAADEAQREKNLSLGRGCPQCGCLEIRRKRRTTSTGWALFFVGLVVALFTCGIGLIISVIGACLSETRAHCSKCRWAWIPTSSSRNIATPGSHASFHCKVAGISYDNDDGTSRQEIAIQCIVGELLVLDRDPENQHDDCAVRVVRTTGQQLGWLGSHVASQVGPHLDNGGIATAHIASITGNGQPLRGVNLKIDLYS